MFGIIPRYNGTSGWQRGWPSPYGMWFKPPRDTEGNPQPAFSDWAQCWEYNWRTDFGPNNHIPKVYDDLARVSDYVLWGYASTAAAAQMGIAEAKPVFEYILKQARIHNSWNGYNRSYAAS